MTRTYYTEDHEWLRLDSDDVATVGITHYAQEQLGDVVYVELPKPGTQHARGDAAAVVESVKAAADVKAPVSGSVIEANDALPGSPELINEDPAGRAWFYKVRLSNPGELAALMDENAYSQITKKK
jgi:glycine cleavage system H protein